MSGGANGNTRWVELDGLRGLAALLVIYVHVFHRWIPGEPGPVFWFRTFSWLGCTGVHLFFVLSGFLIGGILMNARGTKNYFRTFYVRRACRILPLYAVLVVGALAAWAMVPEGARGALFSDTVPGWSYLGFAQNFFMAASGSFGTVMLDRKSVV